MQISQRTNLSDSEHRLLSQHRLLGWLDFSLSLVPVSRKWPMANDKTECQAQAYCLPSREITCGFVLPVYLFIMCYVKWEMASGWLQRFNNATQPIVELHTWFWVSISSPCSITHGLTQTATLNIFCHVAALHIIHNGNPYTLYHDTLATHHPSERKMAYPI